MKNQHFDEALERHLSSTRLPTAARPFPHMVCDDFFRPAVYETLRAQFPMNMLEAAGGEAARSLYRGDEAYEQHLDRSPAWREIFELVHSQGFITFLIEQFAEHWEREGCKLDLSKVRYNPYLEDRADKERLALRQVQHDPHELWCRLDFHESRGVAYNPLHRDQRRRLISMLVFFDPVDDTQRLYGDVILHPSRVDLRLLLNLGMGQAPAFYSRARDRLAGTTRLRTLPNRMIGILNGNESWHSVEMPERAARSRHVRIAVSSSVDCWV